MQLHTPSVIHPTPYRSDIDGLRAVAVLAVVGYHAFPVYVAGGLIGVDIFFVISGFLISSIIFRSLEGGRFSYADFYARRVKRIFPALIVVLGTCLAFGWFAQNDLEYKPLGKHVAGGSAFIANILLWQESGYFARSAVFNQLLHLWSLGIEEQFYFVWPLVLSAIWPWKRVVPAAIGVVLLVSFGLNLLLVESEPTATFYLPATRFWELMLGAVLGYAALGQRLQAVQRSVPCREVLSWTGLALLVCALVFVNYTSAYPGKLALLPTLGAFCLIAAGADAGVNRRLLAFAPLVFVGLLSYPLYLWHWPLLSFAAVLGSAPPSRALRVALVIAALLLAWLTYRFVERPIRRSPGLKIALPLAALTFAIGAAGLAVYRNDGVPARAVNARVLPQRQMLVQAAALDRQMREVTFRTELCADLEMTEFAHSFCSSYGRHDAPRIVLWGDSHAWAWAPVFYDIAREHDLRVITFSVGGCPPLLGVRRADADSSLTSCGTFGLGEQVLAGILAAAPRQLYVIGYWGLYTPPGAIAAQQPTSAKPGPEIFAERLGATLRAFPPPLPITIFRTQPVMRDTIERGLLRKARIEPTAKEKDAEEGAANAAIDAASATRPGVTVFDPTARTCAATCGVLLDGELLYFDKGHVSAQGALLFREQILRDHFGFLQHR
jgi:peptidoglycan/LPS O-acetylase OafA/YrhL